MWVTAAFWSVAVLFSADPPAARPPYPDLSDPRSAAYSLAVALSKGDAKTARLVYTGTNKAFLDFIDATATLAAAADRYNRAVTARYGPEYASSLVYPAGDLELKVNKERLTTLVAVGEVEQKGDDATLTFALLCVVRLKKGEAGWKVIGWPADLSPAEFSPFFRKLAALTIRQAEDVEKGKHPKPHDALRAFRIAVAVTEAAEKQKKDAQKEEKK
jgi:hypothetical protein